MEDRHDNEYNRRRGATPQMQRPPQSAERYRASGVPNSRTVRTGQRQGQAQAGRPMPPRQDLSAMHRTKTVPQSQKKPAKEIKMGRNAVLATVLLCLILILALTFGIQSCGRDNDGDGWDGDAYQ